MDEHFTKSNFYGDQEKCSMLSLNMYMHTTNGKRQRARLCILNELEIRTSLYTFAMTKTLIVNTVHNFFFTNKRICTIYRIPHFFHTANRRFIVLFSKRGSPHLVTFENKNCEMLNTYLNSLT